MKIMITFLSIALISFTVKAEERKLGSYLNRGNSIRHFYAQLGKLTYEKKTRERSGEIKSTVVPLSHFLGVITADSTSYAVDIVFNPPIVQVNDGGCAEVLNVEANKSGQLYQCRINFDRYIISNKSLSLETRYGVEYDLMGPAKNTSASSEVWEIQNSSIRRLVQTMDASTGSMSEAKELP